MSDPQPTQSTWKSSMVITRDHVQGAIIEALQPDPTTAEEQFLLRFDNGQQFVVPASVLTYDQAGSCYRLDVTLDELMHGVTPTRLKDTPKSTADEVILTLAAEELHVSKQEIITGVVRVHKFVNEREEVISQPLTHEEIVVERVAINRLIDAPQALRYEGETMIVPLFEEVLVVEKRLMLKEELHITKRQLTEQHSETVTLRSEDVTVERTPANLP